MEKQQSGIYWVKYNDEWIIANYYSDINKFEKYGSSYRFDESEIIVGSKVAYRQVSDLEREFYDEKGYSVNYDRDDYVRWLEKKLVKE